MHGRCSTHRARTSARKPDRMAPGDITSSSRQPWLTIIGIGEDGWEGLAPAARRAIEGATIVYGGTRHLAFVPTTSAQHIPWPSPMSSAIQEILTTRRGQPGIVVLTS